MKKALGIGTLVLLSLSSCEALFVKRAFSDKDLQQHKMVQYDTVSGQTYLPSQQLKDYVGFTSLQNDTFLTYQLQK